MGNLFQPKLLAMEMETDKYRETLYNISNHWVALCNIYRPHSFRQNGNGLNGVAQQCWMAAGNVTDGTFPSLYTWHYAQLSNHGTRSQMFCFVCIFLNFQLTVQVKLIHFFSFSSFFSFSLAISYVVECFTSQRGGTPLNADWWRSPAHVKGQQPNVYSIELVEWVASACHCSSRNPKYYNDFHHYFENSRLWRKSFSA